FVCALTEGPTRCRSLPGELGSGKLRLALFGTAAKEAWPLVLAGEHGERGLFRSDTGARVAEQPPLGASIAADGAVRILRLDGERFVLDTISADGTPGRPARHPLPRCATLTGDLLWEHGVVECVPAGRGGARALL